MTERPHYKAMYLKADEEVRRLKLDNQARINDALVASRERAQYRNSHSTLHYKILRWLEVFNVNVMETAVEKDGWLQFPMMNPDDTVALRQAMTAMTTYLEKNPPGPM